MFRSRFLPCLAALVCFSGAVLPVSAAQTDCDSIYCFSVEDFSVEDSLAGICITDLPAPEVGTIFLGTRVLRPGDILTAQQVTQMTFSPLKTEVDQSAEVGYLPIYENTVAPAAAMTIAVRGKEDKIPVAEDSALETYKNLPLTGKLPVTDPEGMVLTYTVIRQPKRGSLTIQENGSFTYTPKKNKIGVDSFTFTAADPAGKVSREATVTITILKPTDATQYTDTTDLECRFTAEWMKNTGIFEGECLAGKPCFHPDKEVSRGEFVAMLVKALDIPTEEDARMTLYTDDIPLWLQPYLAAAVRSGLTAGLPDQEVFGADMPITGAEAAVILQNALDLTVSRQDSALESGTAEEIAIPVWAENALLALSDSGMELTADAVLTRAETAQLLYQAHNLQTPSVFSE